MGLLDTKSVIVALLCHIIVATVFPQELTVDLLKTDTKFANSTSKEKQILEDLQSTEDDAINVAKSSIKYTSRAYEKNSKSTAQLKNPLGNRANIPNLDEIHEMSYIFPNSNLRQNIFDTSFLSESILSGHLIPRRQANSNKRMDQKTDGSRSSIEFDIDTEVESSKVEETGGQNNRQGKGLTSSFQFPLLVPSALLRTGITTSRKTAQNIGQFAISEISKLGGAVRETAQNFDIDLPPTKSDGLLFGRFNSPKQNGGGLF